MGTDYGYWHGYRLIRVRRNGKVITDTVPVFVPDGITVSGPRRARVRDLVRMSATGEQPTEEGPEVEALELRDPDRDRPNFHNLPSPARIWTTSNRSVLKPVASTHDDPRRDPRRQTDSGRFRAACPGSAKLTITSGFQSEARRVEVVSRKGRVVRSIRRGRPRIRFDRNNPVAEVRLAQRAQVDVSIRKRGRTVRVLDDRCVRDGRLVGRWNGRVQGRRAEPGTYRARVRVRSDRNPVYRSFPVELRR